jgi:translation initiation factor IF-2
MSPRNAPRRYRYRSGPRGRGSSNRKRQRGSADARSEESTSLTATAVGPPALGDIAIPSKITVHNLSNLLQASPSRVITALMTNGVLATINQAVSYEDCAGVATEFGFTPKLQEEVSEQRPVSPSETTADEKPSRMSTRPPTVTILGHVDHGKTSLLDRIRRTNVMEGETGGITQHIGAYQVEVNERKITFLDTPGHEAFTAMRARGAMATDVAVLVVAADDGVQAQTLEAIDHARAARVPIVVAINKIDRRDANADIVKQQLAEAGLIVEDYGGDIVSAQVSALTGAGFDDLLETILLVAELAELQADPTGSAYGTVIEAKIDRARGVSSTLLVQSGTLRVGDTVSVGNSVGRVRAMFDDRGHRLGSAGPSTPVVMLGLSEQPVPGDTFKVFTDEKSARAGNAQLVSKSLATSDPTDAVSLNEFSAQSGAAGSRELSVVLKTDVQGSLEPIQSSISNISTDDVRVRIIRASAGAIVEPDVLLAKASNAMIVGFRTSVEQGANNAAELNHVEIRLYDVIYRIVEDLQAAADGLIEPVTREVIDGHVEVRQLFSVGRTRIVAGCFVTDGTVLRSCGIRVLREGRKVFEGKLASLKRFKDDVRQVETGYECGIAIEGYNEILQGDIFELFHDEINVGSVTESARR